MPAIQRSRSASARALIACFFATVFSLPRSRVPTKKPDGTRLRGNEKTVAKKQAISARALADLDRWIAGNLHLPAAA